MTRTYATPAAFRQALEQKLADEAKRTGQPLVRVRQMLVFDRFLARVFVLRAAQVIVKGGVVLELRLGRARTTKDIDLWWTGRRPMCSRSCEMPLVSRSSRSRSTWTATARTRS